jgi:hypothetical protein
VLVHAFWNSKPVQSLWFASGFCRFINWGSIHKCPSDRRLGMPRRFLDMPEEGSWLYRESKSSLQTHTSHYWVNFPFVRRLNTIESLRGHWAAENTASKPATTSSNFRRHIYWQCSGLVIVSWILQSAEECRKLLHGWLQARNCFFLKKSFPVQWSNINHEAKNVVKKDDKRKKETASIMVARRRERFNKEWLTG